MKTIKRTIKINLPLPVVFALLTDAHNDQRWMFGMTGTDLLTPGAMHKGSKVICKFGIGPITTMRASAVIEEFDPGRRFVRTRVGGAMSMRGEFAVVPDDGGTRFDWTMEVGMRIPFIGLLLDPLLAAWMDMSIAVSMKKFKALVESGKLAAAPETENVAYNS
jgi:carbon monoxide dehydrogenase subunit G